MQTVFVSLETQFERHWTPAPPVRCFSSTGVPAFLWGVALVLPP